MTTQTTSLTNVKTTKVSLVDRGANRKKRFPFFKAENYMKTFEEILEAVLQTEVDFEKQLGEFCEVEKISDKGAQAVKAALRLLSAFKEEIPQSVFGQLSKLSGFEDPKDPEAEKQVKKLEGEIEQLKKAKSEDKTVLKIEDLPEEIKKQFEDQKGELEATKKQNEKLEKGYEEILKSLETERDIRKRNEWQSKVEKDLAFYPGESVEDMTSELMELEKQNPELAKKHFERMQKVSKAMEDSNLLKTAGFSNKRGDDMTAEDEANKLADEMVTKSENGMTREEALAKVWESNPQLYDRYASENKNQYER
jgi:phage-related protein